MFKTLCLYGWRQFRRVDIEFHPRLTVLTGAKGAGKTTVLNLVSRHFGWQSQFISTPKLRDSSARLSYSTDYWDLEEQFLDSKAKERPPQPVGPQRQIGTIEYYNGATTTLAVQTDNSASSYDVAMNQQQQVEGLHIPSHRATYSYQQVQNIRNRVAMDAWWAGAQ
jgi:predicted ATP-binding protein involved in virulence